MGALAFLLTASAADAIMVTLPSNATINAVGQTTVVNIMIGAVTNVEAMGLSITYNEAIADVLTTGAVVRGPLTTNCDSVVVNIMDPGRVTITAACAGSAVSGSGTLFSITFTGQGNGVTALTFSTFSVDGMVRIPNGCLLNEGSPSCEPANGQLTVGSVAPTATRTATRTNTAAIPTATRTNTSIATATRTNTPIVTATRSSTPTNTIPGVATSTVTNTPVNTATRTNTAVATNTATPVVTATVTDTPTIGPSPTASNTTTPVNTATITSTPVNTGTVTQTFTAAPATATGTVTSTPPPTNTRPGIPVIPSPLSPGGLVMIGGLAVALIWTLHRLQRPQ